MLLRDVLTEINDCSLIDSCEMSIGTSIRNPHVFMKPQTVNGFCLICYTIYSFIELFSFLSTRLV